MSELDKLFKESINDLDELVSTTVREVTKKKLSKKNQKEQKETILEELLNKGTTKKEIREILNITDRMARLKVSNLAKVKPVISCQGNKGYRYVDTGLKDIKEIEREIELTRHSYNDLMSRCKDLMLRARCLSVALETLLEKERNYVGQEENGELDTK